MLNQHMLHGAFDALDRFKVKVADMPAAEVAPAAVGGVFDRLKAFGHGQLDAGKALFSNLRGGLGGSRTLPEGVEGPMASPAVHRQQAAGNLRSLAPSLVAGGALYLSLIHI